MRDLPRRRIAVVGGGLAGLELAVAVADGGNEVEVFEAGPRTRTRHEQWDPTTHVGDQKVRSWVGAGWSNGGGLAQRLGGRSLCYHGVMLPIEPAALADWGPVWRDRLGGDGGAYAAALAGFRAGFPEMTPFADYSRLDEFGLCPVAHAARLDGRGRFESYTPLARILADGSLRVGVTRGAVRAVAAGPGGWSVEVDAPGRGANRTFDACVLAASAIGNVQVLARSLGRDIHTTITDHFCIGAFVRPAPGPPLAPFRHEMLWNGFVELPDLGANLFFLERPVTANGARAVELNAVVEQRGGPRSFSELAVTVARESESTHITAKVSDDDRDRLAAVGAEVRRWAERLADASLIEVVSDGDVPAGAAPWSDHQRARRAVETGPVGAFCAFAVPYGAFEHEACTHPIGAEGPVPVSAELEVCEMPGVYVVGPGVFPRLGAANPALTIIATARWLGGHLSLGAG